MSESSEHYWLRVSRRASTTRKRRLGCSPAAFGRMQRLTAIKSSRSLMVAMRSAVAEGDSSGERT